MPKRKRNSKSSKRRRKRRKAKKQFASLSRLSPIPMSATVKLRYSDCVSINPTTGGTLTFHAFRANGLYDPDRTGIGHQPYGYDQISQFYDHYEVLGSKCTISVNDSTTALTVPVVYGLLLNDDSSSGITNVNWMIESGLSKYAYKNPGDFKTRKLTSKYSKKKFFVNQKDSANVMAPVGSDPTEQADYLIWVAGQCDTASDPTAVFIHVVIDYIVRFSERKEIAQS